MKQEYTISKLVSSEALSHIHSDYITSKIQSDNNQIHDLKKSDFMFHIKGLNESMTIGKVIDDIIYAGFSKMLVVNDGSTDNMADIVKEKQLQYPNTRILLINHLINRRHGC